jgi:hypothetical protein
MLDDIIEDVLDQVGFSQECLTPKEAILLIKKKIDAQSFKLKFPRMNRHRESPRSREERKETYESSSVPPPPPKKPELK